MIRTEDPRIEEPYDLDSSATRAKRSRDAHRLHREAERIASGCHFTAAERVSAEPRAVQHDGKPRKTEPKLQPWEVLQRAGLTREEVAGRIWRDRQPDIWTRLRMAGQENRRREGKRGPGEQRTSGRG